MWWRCGGGDECLRDVGSAPEGALGPVHTPPARMVWGVTQPLTLFLLQKELEIVFKIQLHAPKCCPADRSGFMLLGCGEGGNRLDIC